MNNEELKKKIAQIIAEYCCPLGKTHKQLYCDDRQCYSKMNFAECKPITECTDALIAAEIGDVKEAEHRAEVAELVVKNLNAALRERLEKAVELPCKIGDKVYAIFPIEDELKILDGTFVGIEEVVSDFKGCMCAIIVRQAKDGHYFNTYWDLGQFNKTWWADKEIAESKLAEVMGNHGM